MKIQLQHLLQLIIMQILQVNKVVVLKNGSSWPTASELRNANAYEIKFRAGYGNAASDVPKPLVQAIKMLALHLYENREIATSMNVNLIPNTVAMLFAPYKVLRLNNLLGI